MKLMGLTESYIQTKGLLYIIIYYSKMLILKHLKTLQHVSIFIQIIFRELLVKVTEFKNH